MRFKKIYVEITNQCNLNCSFCVQNHRPARAMSVEEFQSVISQIKPYTGYIYLHVLGEPLMHPNLDQFLQIANENQISVNLTTNGTLMDQNKDLLLINNAVRQINISLHSFPQIPDYLEKVCQVSDKLSAKGVYISYRLWTMKDELSKEMEETIRYIEERYKISIHEYKHSVKLKEHCYLSFDSEFIWPSLKHPFISNEGTCHGFRHMCAILSDGSVVPCCLDANREACLGNIFNTSFDDILRNNEPLLRDFQNHKMTLELCQRCSYRKRFDSVV